MNKAVPDQSAPRQSVWPPPVPGYDGKAIRAPFISQRGRQKAIAIIAAINGVTMVFDVVDQLAGNSKLMVMVNLVYSVNSLVAWIALVVVYLQWVYHTYRNLDAFGTAGKSTSPGWAVGYYCIPVISLYRPYRTMVEVWRASSPEVDSADPSQWSRLRPSPSILVWWLLFIAYDITSYGVALVAMKYQQQNTAGSISVVVLSAMLGIAGLLALYRVVVMIDDRQEAKEKTMVAQQNLADLSHDGGAAMQ